MSEECVYRQGDVLLTEARLPEGEVREIARDSNDKLVLAYGEVTGHHHFIAEPDAKLVQVINGDRYLRVDAPVFMRHEEHAPIPLQPGIFRVVIQREYVPGPVQYREVAD
ncbi:MAG: hypothetical protein GFH27_549287n258 [Chloroflexi bacterium AL-W]|nr:hypothetical protein [Chloroflexi bacterium AL-N1]NOK66532.1 hypothetical protein [Chloroflexi bacterium AL-N10]NOK71920.1 hypothetical protein [Chloroflexi bacterium AL-N5]NOK81177.1 hypothetical protein [Chloroflexi bacterium AL-W]NOK89450.1 hypothetical protein [Chloroflexi bacterium AL-N15]